jgi:tetratricopeptide (TPR) repeat protein
VLAVSACFTLPSSAHAGPDTYSPGKYKQAFGRDFSKLIAAIPPERVNNEARSNALKGLELIGKAKLTEASELLNKALQLDPSNSYLQFFNAFDYHMMALDGDAQKFSLAEQGYLLAIKFDRSNWVAHYYLGTLYFEQRNFRAAQSEFAEVLLSLEDDQEVLFRMVAASYYSQDPVTAAACLDRLRALNPQDAQILRLSAIISAAIGRPEDAKNWLSQYEESNPDENELAITRERLKHWGSIYRNAQAKEPKNSAPYNGAPIAGSDAGIRPAEGSLLPVQFSFPVQEPGQPLPGLQIPSSQSYTPAGSAPLPVTTSDGRMVLVDVVLMYTEDTLSTSKGVNLLNTLTMQFGGSRTISVTDGTGHTSAGSNTSTTTDGVNTVTSGTSGTTSGSSAASTALTSAISIPALTYSLNIANANTNLNEVLARPTLAALNGMKSEFFSGETLDAAVVSTGANTGGAVQLSKEIGIRLTITPIFMPDGKIQLTVDAQRTFLKPPSSNVGFTYKVEVSKVMVNANVTMGLGETLVLGGLSEKETSKARDGVPFLQDIPLLQYFFSTQTSSNYQRSVLMLITPRLPQYTYRADDALRFGIGQNSDVESMKELRARYGDWFSPYPNMASVFHHLDSSSLYREFRTGDVTLEKWDRQETSLQRLKQALGFLYY